jgi:hypothetical protein
MSREASPSVRSIVVGLCVAAMVLVPLTALDEQRPAFLGWHMYASHASKTTVTMTRLDGSIKTVSLSTLAGRVRAEVDFREATLTWVCAKYPDVRSVRLDRTFPPIDWQRSCGRS